MQAVDGAGQAVIFRGQAGIILLQGLALLAQAIIPVQTLMGKKNQEGQHQSQRDGDTRQEPVIFFTLLGPILSRRACHRFPLPRSSLSPYFA